LPEESVLTEKLDRLFQARAVNADLDAPEEPETVLESDQGSAIETKQVVHQIAKVTLSEGSRKAVCHPERASVQRHSHGRGERDERVVRLRGQYSAIVIWLILLCAGRGRDCKGQEKDAQQKR
jgi:hypothetical protein